MSENTAQPPLRDPNPEPSGRALLLLAPLLALLVLVLVIHFFHGGG